MKKVTLPLIASVFVTMVIALGSCSKEGPVGPVGAQGPPGPTGAQGPAGAKGDPGTANVIYSNWLDVDFTSVNDTADDGTITPIAWLADIDAPRLDASILSTGEIKVYINIGTADDPEVIPLPLFDSYALTGVLNINLTYSIGNIFLYATDDASTFVSGGKKLWQYRYILIPGGTAARKAAPAIDWNNYTEVKKYLNLPD